MSTTIAQYAKFIAALIGAFVTAFAGLTPPEWAPWLQGASAFLTAAAVILVPNAPTERQRQQIETPRHSAQP